MQILTLYITIDNNKDHLITFSFLKLLFNDFRPYFYVLCDYLFELYFVLYILDN